MLDTSINLQEGQKYENMHIGLWLFTLLLSFGICGLLVSEFYIIQINNTYIFNTEKCEQTW